MRRQYHFHEVGGHHLIWDVHRLIDLSRSLSIIEVPLASIKEFDQPFWFPASRPSPTCREIANHAKLISETDLKHPIILGSDGRVMDGMHRVCKASIAGLTTIKAVRFDQDPEPDHIDVPPESLSYDEPW